MWVKNLATRCGLRGAPLKLLPAGSKIEFFDSLNWQRVESRVLVLADRAIPPDKWWRHREGEGGSWCYATIKMDVS